jgi:homocysteine S-methyltransferase
MSGHDLAAVGANCGNGPEQIGEAVRQLRAAGAGTIAAMPNAGLPQRVGGRFAYISGPDYFAAAARSLVRDGATLVGGCCGTTPAHIAAMRRAIDTAAPLTTPGRDVRQETAEGERAPIPLVSKLATQLRRGEFVFSVELTPPRGINPRRMLEGAHLLKEAGVDFANVTDSAMARLRMGVMSCAALVQQQVGLESIAHFTTRDRNVMAIQSELIGAHALGIRNVLCMRGDPPRIGDYPNATAVWDVNAVGLITILSNLNQGQDANGTMIGDGADFFIGAAFNPTSGNMERELRLLQRKIDAGAQFLVTNPVYDPRAFNLVKDRLAELKVPVLMGLMPLASARHASYLQHEVPGIVVPDAVLERIERAGDDAAKVGVEMALELLAATRGVTQGAYVIPAIGRYDLAAQVVLGARAMVS